MKSTQFVEMSDGHQVFVRMYRPISESVRGYVHLLHGMAEHSGRYDRFCELLAGLNYFVAIHDHRGHGETAKQNGKLGYFCEQNGFERVVEDAYEIMHYLRTTYQLPRPIVFGHSMGSFILRRFMQLYTYDLDAAILSGTGEATPLHAIGHRVATALARVKGGDVASALMNDLSFGSFNKAIPNPRTAYDWLTRDERAVQKYIDDPCCGFIATNQFFADLTGGLLQIHKTKEMVRVRNDLPVLFLSGSNDPVGGKGASGVYNVAKQLEAVGVQRVAVYIFEGMRHEILNEKNKEHVYAVVTGWLKNEQKI